MTVHQQMLIYAAYRISPEMGQACEDVIRCEKPTRLDYDRLYKLIKEAGTEPEDSEGHLHGTDRCSAAPWWE